MTSDRNTAIREFDTGAMRDTDKDKFDYDGFLSPLVIERYGEYMHAHRKMLDGSMRDSDNWQRGIPMKVYMKSLWRHFFDVWKIHRGGVAHDPSTGKRLSLDYCLCAVLFNAMGMLHEHLKGSAALQRCDKELERISHEMPATKACAWGITMGECDWRAERSLIMDARLP